MLHRFATASGLGYVYQGRRNAPLYLYRATRENPSHLAPGHARLSPTHRRGLRTTRAVATISYVCCRQSLQKRAVAATARGTETCHWGECRLRSHSVIPTYTPGAPSTP